MDEREIDERVAALFDSLDESTPDKPTPKLDKATAIMLLASTLQTLADAGYHVHGDDNGDGMIFMFTREKQIASYAVDEMGHTWRVFFQ